MPTKHIVFDETLLFWDAQDTSVVFTVALSPVYSGELRLDTLGINAQSEKHFGVALSWPGVDSAGAATTQLIMYSGAATAPTGVIATFPAQTLANTKAIYQDAERCVFPIPMLLTLAYFRIGFTVAAADLTAGTLTAGLVPLAGY